MADETAVPEEYKQAIAKERGAALLELLTKLTDEALRIGFPPSAIRIRIMIGAMYDDGGVGMIDQELVKET